MEALKLTQFSLGEIVLYIASLASSLGLTKIGYSRIKKKVLESQYIRGLNSRARTLEIFKRMATCGVDRVLLFNGSNCGGLPRAGAPYFATCIEAIGNNIDQEAAMAYGVGIRVDEHYSTMLKVMIEKDVVDIVTEDLPDKSLIKSLYLAEGVTHSRWYYIGIVEGHLKYYSVSRHDGNAFSDNEKTRLKLKLLRIRNEILKGKPFSSKLNQT